MTIVIIILFILGFAAISAEQFIRVSKTAIALVLAIVCWVLYSFSSTEPVTDALSHHLAAASEIIFFLIGAMTIVELIDSWQGFQWITDLITTRNPRMLLWVIGGVTFFLSAVLDNLTTAIVMVSLMRKLVAERDRRLLFAGIIIIAANAGGAWSPVGDVTTTMLWIGGQISAAGIIKSLFIPGLICALVPVLILTFRMPDTPLAPQKSVERKKPRGSLLVLLTGLAIFLAIPVFKILTGLPPYAGMLLGVGLLWLLSEIIDNRIDTSERKPLSASAALSRIDISSALFFLGILLTVGALESVGVLANLAGALDHTIGDNRIIITVIGLFSAVVDNVPLVAASIGMYSLDQYPADNMIWQYLAYCAGTGGSILIVGSAAGVAVMGMENISFTWYLRHIGGPAFLGYVAGAMAFLIING